MSIFDPVVSALEDVASIVRKVPGVKELASTELGRDLIRVWSLSPPVLLFGGPLFSAAAVAAPNLLAGDCAAVAYAKELMYRGDRLLTYFSKSAGKGAAESAAALFSAQLKKLLSSEQFQELVRKADIDEQKVKLGAGATSRDALASLGRLPVDLARRFFVQPVVAALATNFFLCEPVFSEREFSVASGEPLPPAIRGVGKLPTLSSRDLALALRVKLLELHAAEARLRQMPALTTGDPVRIAIQRGAHNELARLKSTVARLDKQLVDARAVESRAGQPQDSAFYRTEIQLGEQMGIDARTLAALEQIYQQKVNEEEAAAAAASLAKTSQEQKAAAQRGGVFYAPIGLPPITFAPWGAPRKTVGVAVPKEGFIVAGDTPQASSLPKKILLFTLLTSPAWAPIVLPRLR